MLYTLSKLIPVRFTSTYGVEDAGHRYREHSTWWQYRDRVFRHRRTILS